MLVGHLTAQMNPSNKRDKDLIRQYGFSVYSVPDTNSDSIRILSYLYVPNHVLQFIKSGNGFEAEYEATILLKEKKGIQLDRKHWSKTLKTQNYVESVSREIFTIHFHEFKVPFALLHCTNVYPTPPELVRLGAMVELQENFPDAVIGLSDHTVTNLSLIHI